MFGFTGHELDDETGLYYAKARFYDPELGRFLTEDPVFGDLSDPPSLHWYTYGKVNPTVHVDPDGRIAVTREEQDALGQRIGFLEGEVETLQAEFDEISTSERVRKDPYALIKPAQDLQAVKDALAEARERFAEGEVFFKKVGELLVEDQGEVGVDALTYFIMDVEGVWLARAAEVAASILGPAPCESTVCQLHEPFIGMGKYAEGAEKFVALAATTILPEMIFVEASMGTGGLLLADDVVRSELVASEVAAAESALGVTARTRGGRRAATDRVPAEAGRVRTASRPDVSFENLDWDSVVPKKGKYKGQNRRDHVRLHNVDNPAKKAHGVFLDDGVAVTNQAWKRANALGLKPDASGLLVVRMNRQVGWAGGQQGAGAAVPLDSVTIRVVPGTNQIITAFPSL